MLACGLYIRGSLVEVSIASEMRRRPVEFCLSNRPDACAAWRRWTCGSRHQHLHAGIFPGQVPAIHSTRAFHSVSQKELHRTGNFTSFGRQGLNHRRKNAWKTCRRLRWRTSTCGETLAEEPGSPSPASKPFRAVLFVPAAGCNPQPWLALLVRGLSTTLVAWTLKQDTACEIPLSG